MIASTIPALSLPQLLPGTVQVRCASVERPPQEIAAFYSLLSADEKARAERFYFSRDRNRYIAGRGLLRTFLAGYLQVAPSQVQFHYGPCGKPGLSATFDHKALQFNLSHSHHLALYAFSWERRVGIDIEQIRPLPDEDRFAGEIFSPRECAYLRSLSGAQKREAFFKLWTGKEALVKASGKGWPDMLDLSEAAQDSETPAGWAFISEDGGGQPTRWRLKTFSPAEGYRASLATEGHDGGMDFQMLEA
jgi:4'-phosphopantetheinyl transferase